MVAVGMLLIWGGYTVGIWGYCLVRSYDVTFGNLFAPTWPGTQVSMTGPTKGHKLGTINGPGVSVTDPGQQNSDLGQ